MRALICMHLSMMQSDLPYTTDQLLSRRPFNYIVQLLSSPQRRVLFEQHLRSTSPLGSKESLECNYIGVLHCRRSRAIRRRSDQSPSRPTASRSSLALRTAQSGSGTPTREQRCRRSRAIHPISIQSPSRPMASCYHL
jgi:hypothetical protein